MAAPVVGRDPDSASERSQMLATLAVIDSAATSLSAPLLTRADLARARDAHRAAQRCVAPRDAAGATWWNAAFHRALTARCPNRRMTALLGEELAMLNAVSGPADPDWADLARAMRDHATLLGLVQSSPRSGEIGRLVRAHWRTCC